jgi:hypothetical protein
MSEQVSLARLYLLRGMYLGNLVMLGSGIWPELVGLHRAWEPLPAVVFSFWAALGALSALGLRYPLAMVPLLFLQLLYKVVWLLAVWLPLQVGGATNDLRVAGLDLPGGVDLYVVFIVGVVLDLVVIPWPYVLARFVRTHGERWSDRRPAHAPQSTQQGVRAALQSDKA